MALPQLILPQLATPAKEPPEGDFLAEIKLDGYRLLGRREGNDVSLHTRRGHRWTHKFPALVESVRQLPGDGFWLDGELVVMNREGRSCYGSLQEAVANLDQECLAYYVFDLLWLEGKNLCMEPIETRKHQLADLIGEGADNLKYVDHYIGDLKAFFAAVCEQRLEGIVCKRLGSVYKPERRSPDWLKV